MSDGLRLYPLGVGDAFSAESYTSCLALETEGRWLLVDCPHPIRKMMREAGVQAGVTLDLDRVDGVVLTHLHADHSSGLEGLAYYTAIVLGRRVALLAHPDVLAPLWDRHLAASMVPTRMVPGASSTRRRLEDYVEVVPLDEARAVACGPFRVECRPTLHLIPTAAVRVTAGGRTLGYSADTAFDPTLVAWLAAADLIVHETNLGPHTPYADLAALPAELRRRLRLIHYPDGFVPPPGGLELLRQGTRIEV